jgi:hypothetical protein
MLDMKALDMKMYRDKSLTMNVLLGLVVAGCLLPRQAEAQVTDISSFNSCVSTVGAAGGKVADAVNMCVPSSGCYYTNTMSEESAQFACTLRDGTRLPRVIFSCTGSGGSQTLRFRPSFSLCTLGVDGGTAPINHIEQGEDVAQRIDHQTVMKMADITFSTLNPPVISVDTTATPICKDCHDRLGTTPVGSFRLFGQIPPLVSEGTIDSNDPSVQKPASPVPLSVICSDIFNSTQLAKNPAKEQAAFNLCQALLNKEH